MITKIVWFSVIFVTLVSCWNKTEVPESTVEWKRYVAEAKECPLIDYSCDEWETRFIDEAWCGCEEISYEEFSQGDDLPEATDTKEYIADTQRCQVIDYTCKNNWSAFNDDIWCGCEESSEETALPEATDTKYYVGNTNKCMVIRYTCEENWSYFSDDIWCGCEVK